MVVMEVEIAEMVGRCEMARVLELKEWLRRQCLSGRSGWLADRTDCWLGCDSTRLRSKAGPLRVDSKIDLELVLGLVSVGCGAR